MINNLKNNENSEFGYETNENHSKIIKDLTGKISFLVTEIQKINVNCEQLMQDNQTWRKKYNDLKNCYIENIEKGTFIEVNPTLPNSKIKTLEEKHSRLEHDKQHLRSKIKEILSEIDSIKKKNDNDEKNLLNNVEGVYKKEINRLQDELDNIIKNNESEKEKYQEFIEEYQNLELSKKEMEENLINKIENVGKEEINEDEEEKRENKRPAKKILKTQTQKTAKKK